MEKQFSAVNPNTIIWDEDEVVEMSAYENEREEGNAYEV